MKASLLLLVFFFASFGSFCVGEPAVFNVLTYNIECPIYCDPSYPWKSRLEDFRDIFARHQPDLLGIQELITPGEVRDIISILPTNDSQQWAAFFFQHGPLNLSDADATIFYRQDVFTLVSSGSYWLSPTPDTPFSRGFAEKQVVPRLVVWTLFTHIATQKTFYMATTHFDNNAPSQMKSAPLVLERTFPSFKEMIPILFVGDLNSDFHSPAFRNMTAPPGWNDFFFDDSFNAADEWAILTREDNPNPDFDPMSRIDHILIQNPLWNVLNWYVDMYSYPFKNQTYPSDHLAISARVQLLDIGK